jgi:para-aminobenzoate synthetase component 1
MDIATFAAKLDSWGQARTPFIFIVDFEMEMPQAWPLAGVDDASLFFDFNGVTNKTHRATDEVVMSSSPISPEVYRQKFDIVMNGLLRGDSFLTNLTITTPVRVNKTLEELFFLSKAKYKFMMRDRFLVFSPETFVQVSNNTIRTFPMKGTIDAGIEDARAVILGNAKERAEHITIVDLLRNDLSQVASDVCVERFRYVDRIRTNRKDLLQVSSEITGQLLPEYRGRLGSMLVRLLPAGSVSGAPKTATLNIIRAAEKKKRGYYSGICGYFDGLTLDCGVMIRFVELEAGGMNFRSGGGITTQSTATDEYQEALDKIYVPLL